MVWDRTVVHRAGRRGDADVAGLHEPRIEPEVVFGLAAPLPADGDARAMLDAVAWIAAGFEIVHSVFPGWKFRAPDCTAAFGLHGRLVVGPPTPVEPRPARRAGRRAADVPATLRRDGAVVDSGVGANVLDGPAHALAHLRDVLASQPRSRRSPPARS